MPTVKNPHEIVKSAIETLKTIEMERADLGWTQEDDFLSKLSWLGSNELVTEAEVILTQNDKKETSFDKAAKICCEFYRETQNLPDGYRLVLENFILAKTSL